MAKKNILCSIIFLVLFVCVLGSCNQDSIFADIAFEPPYKDPLIAGSPTNLVLFNNTMYVTSIGSGRIHWFIDGIPQNTTIDAPTAGGRIVGLAATDDYLFALVSTNIERTNNSLYRYRDSVWTEIDKTYTGTDSLQTIYGAGDALFVGAKSISTWKVYYVTGAGDSLSPDSGVSGQLNGAAVRGTPPSYSDYYIATSTGIYSGSAANSISTTAIDGSAGSNVTGILNVNGTITAVTYDGKIMTVRNTYSNSSSNKYTGAMGVWKNPDNSGNDLLLLGVEGSENNNKGYREVNLNGSTLGGVPASPGTSTLSTITPDKKSSYDGSIARYNVYHILQYPGSNLVFASTTKNGLYVLKDGQWNVQD